MSDRNFPAGAHAGRPQGGLQDGSPNCCRCNGMTAGASQASVGAGLPANNSARSFARRACPRLDLGRAPTKAVNAPVGDRSVGARRPLIEPAR